MNTNPPSLHPVLEKVLALLLFPLLASALPAEQFGDFTYRVASDNTISIIDYPEDAVGEVVIPAEIDGKPVISIDWRAFHGCSGITSVWIPESVISPP